MKVEPRIITSDGQSFPTLAEAKAHELEILPISDGQGMAPEMARWLVLHSPWIIRILSDKPTGLPRKRRKDAGVRKIKEKGGLAA